MEVRSGESTTEFVLLKKCNTLIGIDFLTAPKYPGVGGSNKVLGISFTLIIHSSHANIEVL